MIRNRDSPTWQLGIQGRWHDTRLRVYLIESWLGGWMSEIDVAKEQIAYLKFWLGVLVVTDISLFG